MKPLNTIPIENYIEKVRIALKSNQKFVNLPISEATDLQNCLSIVMTRLVAKTDEKAEQAANTVITVSMDGGRF